MAFYCSVIMHLGGSMVKIIKQIKLSSDLESGHWDELYGEVLDFDRYDAGYFFIFAG